MRENADTASRPTERHLARAEEALLVRCARTARTLGNDRRIKTLLEETLDWDYVLQLADDHGMGPLLYWHLGKDLKRFVPSNVVGRLRDRFHFNNLRNLLLAGELLKLLALFERYGISAVPYKGPALAASVYKNLALRQAGDLDVLLGKRDILKAKDVLVSLGYEPTPWLTATRLTPAQELAFLRFEREYAFWREDTAISVELQWEIIPTYFSFSLSLDALGERLQRVSVGGDAVPTLAPEDLLLVLCVHGSKHLWERLLWICDVAETVNVYRGMDWDNLLKRAAELGSERMVLLGLSLAHDLLQADLPEEVVHRARADSQVGKLVTEVREKLFRDSVDAREVLEGSAFHAFHYRMRERRRDRLGYALRKVTEPNETDWMEHPLPESLFPLYYVLRPLRLAGKYGQRLFGRYSR